LKTVLLFSSVALALSVLAAPVLQQASEKYAQNKAFGIDHVLTGSVKKSNRYVVRKSVLSQKEQRLELSN